jgi:hypothetical protein
MTRAWLLLLISTGCDQVFGLETRMGDAPAIIVDIAPDAIPVPACTTPGQVIELPLLADTYLDVTAKHGTDPVLKLSNTPQTVLLRVALADRAPQIATVQVELRFVFSAGACAPGGGCSACVIAPGMVGGYWMRPDWEEAVADRQVRKPGVPWETPGAAGPTDRSTLIVMAAQSGDLTLVMPLDPTKLQAAWPQDELGIALAGVTSFAGTYASREIADNSCASTVAPPRVTATCR